MEELALLTREGELIRAPFGNRLLPNSACSGANEGSHQDSDQVFTQSEQSAPPVPGKFHGRQLRDVDEIPGDCKETERVGTYGTTECNIHDECVSPINVHPDRLARNEQFSSRPASTARRVIGGGYKMAEN